MGKSKESAEQKTVGIEKEGNTHLIHPALTQILIHTLQRLIPLRNLGQILILILFLQVPPVMEGVGRRRDQQRLKRVRRDIEKGMGIGGVEEFNSTEGQRGNGIWFFMNKIFTFMWLFLLFYPSETSLLFFCPLNFVFSGVLKVPVVQQVIAVVAAAAQTVKL